MFGIEAANISKPYALLFHASASDTSVTTATAAIPTTTRKGDLIVVSGFAQGGSPGSPTWTGFTNIVNNVDSGGRITVAYKVSDGTDAGNNLSRTSGSNNGDIIVVVFRGHAAIKTVAVQDADVQTTDGDPTAQTLTAGGGSTPLIAFGVYGSTSAVSTRTFSTTEDSELSSSTRHYLKYKIYNKSVTPSNATIDTGDNGTNNALASFYIEAS